MIGLRAYLAAGAVAAVLGACGLIWWQHKRIETLHTRAETAEARARAARAEIALLRKEIDSDKRIAAIPDSSLGAAIPDRWRLRDPK